MGGRIVRKAVLLVLIVSGLGWLFLKTVRETNAEPYTIDREDLSGWTLALEDPVVGGPGVLVLQPPVGMPAELFRQIFLRSGLSMAGPARPSMPIVLRSEYGKDVAAALSPPEMLEAARATGLERERLEPRCMVARQESSSGPPSQRFFVIFESPGFTRVREDLGRLLSARGVTGFDPAALRPVLAVASTEPDFDRWVWPLRVNPDSDCVAPIALAAEK
jgi:hypothetical protein